MSNIDIYERPRYYHAAFPEIGGTEKRLLQTCFEDHVPFEVRRVLEPACGTGRLLVGLAQAGLQMTGYDISSEMVAFSKDRIAREGLGDRVTVLQGDMLSMRFEEQFDSAVIPINSIGYLVSDDEILAHLRNTAAAIKPGGIYIIQLGCASEHFEPEGVSWSVDEDGVKGRVRWGCKREDRERRLAYTYCRFDVVDNGTEVSFEDEHVCRLWFYEDLKRLIQESGKLVLEAVYKDLGERVDMRSKITSKDGNLFYVLKVI